MSQDTGRIALVGGGVRSGKSSFALRWAEAHGKRRAFIATSRVWDAEMADRIDRHRRERGDRYETFEEPEALAARLKALAGFDVVVVDCLTLWLSQLLLNKLSTEEILQRVDGVVDVLKDRRFHAVLVSNEVGMSVHPETALGRRFQDLAGWTHQRIAAASDEVYLAVLGSVLQVKPSALTWTAP